MDNERFDTLAKTLAAGADRRRVLRGLAAGAFVALAGRFGPGAGAAAKDRRRKKRRRARGGVGAAATTCGLVGAACAASEECCPGSVCRVPAGGGPMRCRCRYRRTECGGKCWVLATSETHCGRCDNPCAAGQRCCGGACHDACPGGQAFDPVTCQCLPPPPPAQPPAQPEKPKRKGKGKRKGRGKGKGKGH
jgi:hypothetical protein